MRNQPRYGLPAGFLGWLLTATGRKQADLKREYGRASTHADNPNKTVEKWLRDNRQRASSVAPESFEFLAAFCSIDVGDFATVVRQFEQGGGDAALMSSNMRPTPPYVAPDSGTSELAVGRPVGEPGACRRIGLPLRQPFYVERQAPVAAILNSLQNTPGGHVAVTTSIHGAGGFGKTTIAAAVAQREEVSRLFSDVIWIELGEAGSALVALSTLFTYLAGRPHTFRSQPEALAAVNTAVAGRNVLLIVDDVWDWAHLDPFLRITGQVTVLITTRINSIAANLDRRITVDQVTLAEATQMLAAGMDFPPDKIDLLEQFAARLSRWPLLLGLAHGQFRRFVQENRDAGPAHAFARLVDRYERLGVRAFDSRTDSARRAAVARTIDVSLGMSTEPERLLFLDLCICKDDQAVPLSTIQHLGAARELAHRLEPALERLDDLGLVSFARNTATVRLHDSIRLYGIECLGREAVRRHRELVDSWGDCTRLPDRYAWGFVGYHMREAGITNRLAELLLDPDWIVGKLANAGLASLFDEYAAARTDQAVAVLHDAIRRACHVLATRPETFLQELLLRLPARREQRLRQFTRGLRTRIQPVVLEAVRTTLNQPSATIKQMLVGCAGQIVQVVGLGERCARVAAASRGKDVVVWELHDGRVVYAGAHPGGTARLMASNRRGSRLYTSCGDAAVVPWSIGRRVTEMPPIACHAQVTALAPAAGDRRLLVGFEDGSVGAIDIATGREDRHVTISEERAIRSVVHDEENHRLFATDGWAVYELDAVSLEPVQSHPVRGAGVTCLGLPNSGGPVLLGTDTGQLLSLRGVRRQPRRLAQFTTGSVSAIRSLGGANADELIVCGPDAIFAFDLRSGESHPVADSISGKIRCAAPLSDGGTVALGGGDAVIRVIDPAAGAAPRPAADHDAAIVGLAPAGRGPGRFLSFSRDGAYRSWSLGSGDRLTEVGRGTIGGGRSALVRTCLPGPGQVAVFCADGPYVADVSGTEGRPRWRDLTPQWRRKYWEKKAEPPGPFLRRYGRRTDYPVIRLACAHPTRRRSFVLGDSEGLLYVLDPRGNAELFGLWSKRGRARRIVRHRVGISDLAAVPATGQVAVTTKNRLLYLYGVDAGKPSASKLSLPAEPRTLHITGQYALVGDVAGGLAMVDLTTRALRWHCEFGIGRIRSVRSADDYVIVLGDDGRCVIASTADGSVLSRMTLDTAATDVLPLLRHRFAVGDRGGNIHIFALSRTASGWRP